MTVTVAVDYEAWARTYDSSRVASSSVVEALRASLGQADGRSLLDIGAGTGNFAVALAEAGFDVSLCDVTPAMLRCALPKLGHRRLAAAAAESLPFRDDSFDCAISVNVIHHLRDREAAYTEATRVLRAGPLVIRTTTREAEASHWAHAYFPTLARSQPASQSEAEMISELERAGFANVSLQRFWYEGAADGSFQGLKYDPKALVTAARRRLNAVFKRLPEADLARGVASLEDDIASGRVQETIEKYRPALERFGDGVVVAART